jgi:hypothetical protein
MSCQALKANLRPCRNWSCLDSDFCAQHKSLSREEFKKRWVSRFILGQQGYVHYTHWNQTVGVKMLSDMESKRIILTPADIANIPPRDRYLDIYLFLVKHGYAKEEDNIDLLARAYWYYIEKSISVSVQWPNFPLQKEIRDILILNSGKTFFRFLMSLAKLSKSRQKFVTFAVQEVPKYLDSPAAKELSWWCHKDLDALRLQYEKELSVDHTMTKCLVQRWLLDLKELYITEKFIQKLKMDHCKEELMMNRWHPSRLEKYLNMGYEIDQLDDIM